MVPDSLLSVSALQSDVQLLREKAQVMYRQLPNVLIFTFVATAGLILYYRDLPHLWTWWVVMQLISLARLASLVVWRRYWSQSSVVAHAELAIRMFVGFSLLTGVLWALFSIVFFTAFSGSQRLVVAMVMATVAAGSVNVLALVPWASRLFIALLMVPLITLFATTGEMDDLVIAGLGLALFIGLTGFARVANESAAQLILMARQREQRWVEVSSECDALLRDKTSLESRLAEKVERLELEMMLRERYAVELARIAALDSVTGLLNRSAFERELRLTRLTAANGAPQRPLTIIVLEILRFDLLELLGVSVSEQVLVAVAERLREYSGAQSLIARWGGAEFALAVTGDLNSGQFGAALRTSLQTTIETDSGPLYIDIMMGVAQLDAGDSDLDELIYRASVAKHSLRQQQLGGVKVFDAALDVVIGQRQKLRRALHAALQTDGLTLVFQPIAPCATAGPCKMEALLRWDEPELGAVSPALFIPVAEESGLIVPLGRWVLSEACRTAVQWPADVIVSVNVSMQQILSGGLLDDVQAALAESGLAAHRLELEITESVFSCDIDLVCQVLVGLREHGIQLAIDDFGTGYSSLAYLQRLPVDVVKIDRCFIADLDQAGRKLLLAMVSMARGLGFRVVVEGVETAEQQNLLAAIGVDYLQGYFIARPMPAQAVSSWLSGDAIQLAAGD